MLSVFSPHVGRLHSGDIISKGQRWANKFIGLYQEGLALAACDG